MSAVPDNIVAFTLPKKPRIKEKDALPDQRKVAVLPFKAVFDDRLTPGSLQVLAAVCAYCNRAGITWVSQARLAKELQITRQAVTNQLTRLRAAGYVEIMKKGYPGQRCNTLRVIFDSTVDAETAMAVTSRYEDNRPPAIKEEQDRQMYEQPNPEGQRRIAQLIAQAFKNPNQQPERIMPKSGETRAVKQVKEAMAQTKAKRSRTVDKTVDKSKPMDTPQCPIDKQPTVSSQGSIGHSTVSCVDTPECPITRIEHTKESLKESLYKDLKTVMGNQEIKMLIDNGMTIEQVREAEELIAPLFAAEGLTPSSAVMSQAILQMHRDAR
jgi:DNA-binding transcriptional ArsR family regulator